MISVGTGGRKWLTLSGRAICSHGCIRGNPCSIVVARRGNRAVVAKHCLVAVAVATISLTAVETVRSQTVPAPIQRTAYSPDSPAQWLSYEGKPDAWYTATDSCRHLLRTLDIGQPLVERHLPNIRRYAEMLGRVSERHAL